MVALYSFFKVLAVVAILSPCAVQAAWWNPLTWWANKGPNWDGLLTTFALDGVVSWLPFVQTTGYQPVPRTVQDALSQNWIAVSTSCDNNGQFNGFRYIHGSDNSVSALFDKNDSTGVIVGIQMNIKVSDAIANNNTYKYDQVPMFQRNTFNGVDMYTLTAYFMDAATICTVGRAANAIVNEGTGTQLSFQNGSTPSSLILVPYNRTVALDQGWSDNKCFVGMGVHCWYQQEHFQDTDCNTLLPVFLLYNKQNQLIGYGFQHVGKSIAPRFEQPSANAVKAIVGDKVSPCLLERANTIGVTTMHVYFISNPLSQNCVV